MPNVLRKISIALWISLAAAAGLKAQPSFSLKTNSDFPTMGADFGYRFGRLQPFVGVSNYTFKTTTQTSYSPAGTGIGDTSKTALTIFITSLGMRVWLRDQGLKPYLFANVYKLLTFADNSGNTKQEDKDLAQMFSPWGMGAGFGAEYPISEQFAVFGEYGFRALFPNSETTTDLGGAQTEKREFSAMFSMLSGCAGMRFYF